MTWRTTGVTADSLRPGVMREVMVESKSVLMARVGPLVFAVDAVCPHIGGLLPDGKLAGRRLTCPLHGAVFDVGTGAVLADPFGVEPPEGGVEPVASYPTRVEAGVIEVDLP
ncbi:MAG: Rieske (2Fe-2S) protein [Candidatus Lutacidiplasmatales archaeon]|nr:Rieske (2Fe-2S) protein [Thermoplasmata archaeon]